MESHFVPITANMSKREFISLLISLRFTLGYHLFGSTLLTEYIVSCAQTPEKAEKLKIDWPHGTQTLSGYANNLLNIFGEPPNPLQTVRENTNIVVFHSMLKLIFRTIQNYASRTDQYDVFKQQPWYQFTRILVNALSHGLVYDFHYRGRDITTLLPMTYDGMSIDVSQEHQMPRITIASQLKLIDEMISFASTLH